MTTNDAQLMTTNDAKQMTTNNSEANDNKWQRSQWQQMTAKPMTTN